MSEAAVRHYEEEDYYHGLLPREDIPHLLTSTGDYLLRVSQQKVTDPRSLIISVATSSSQQKHFVVQEKTDGGESLFSIDGNLMFKSVGNLIDHFRKKKTPLNDLQASTVLIKAVHRAAWELLHDNITRDKKLGEGAFGEVWKGKLRVPSTNKTYDVAIKVAKMEDMNKEKIKEVMKEARLMRNYEHPNVVRLYGVVVEKEPLMIVMEFINGGALSAYLRNNIVDVKEKIDMCLGAAQGIEYLHKKNCIHRDLAARNCLYAIVENEKVVKIADFGLSREGKAYQLKAMRMVPVKWLAPETISTLTYTSKSDVWSFGVLMYEIFNNGIEPWSHISNMEAKEKILAGEKMEFPPETPAKLAAIAYRDCWETVDHKRSSMEKITRKLEKLLENENSGNSGSIMPSKMKNSKKSKESGKRRGSQKKKK